MQDGFLRAAAASIPVAVADPRRNAAACCARIDQAHRAHAALLVLPELCVTGYTCGDLFLSALLLDAAEAALTDICAHTQNCDPVVVLGVPLRAGGKLYNCAAVLHRGRILGIVPKTWLPNYDVFAEKRCFTSAAAYSGPGCVPVGGQDVPFGTGLVFACAQMPAFRLGVELCEDVWAPVPPSVRLCLAGATVIANCSASPEAAGKPAHRRTLLRAASARGLCGYVYANAGPDESTARAVFSAHHLIAENGTVLAEHAPFAPEPGLLVTELDLLTLTAERRRNTTFVPEGESVRAVTFSMPLRPTPLGRAVSPHPFVPDDAEQRTRRADGIRNEYVRVVLHELQGLVAVILVHAQGNDRADVGRGQKLDQAAHARLTAEIGRHGFRLGKADALDGRELFRLVLQHVQRITAEARHEQRRRRRADAAHGAPGEVGIDRVRRLRHGALGKLGLELLAVRRVRHPAAGDDHRLTRHGIRNTADDHRLAAVVHVQLEDGVAVFLILIDDRRDGAA